MRRLTRDEFITRAQLVHGVKYDYGNSNYKNNNTKVILTCRTHGEFLQTPRDHLQGRGCAMCAGNVPLTTEGFIIKAEAVHGDRYTYENTVYSKHNQKVDITCKIHGVFSQLANSHLSGSGCLKCAGTEPLTDQGFITRAISVHGDTYEYPCVKYTKMTNPVNITCRIHGEFSQKAGNHLSGKGCRICGGTSTHTEETFISKASKVHGDKYSYARTVYVRNSDEITIGCPTHGEFYQTPHNHLLGKGCPSCATTGFNPNKPSFLYFLVDTETQSLVKIGVSNTPNKRLVILKRETPFNIERIDLFETPPGITLQIEKFCHSQLGSANLSGFDGATEWFKFDGGKLEVLREFIKSCGGTTPLHTL